MIGLDKCYTTAVFCRSKSQIHAVKNLNLEVNDGELLGILGHNGAGSRDLVMKNIIFRKNNFIWNAYWIN